MFVGHEATAATPGAAAAAAIEMRLSIIVSSFMTLNVSVP